MRWPHLAQDLARRAANGARKAEQLRVVGGAAGADGAIVFVTKVNHEVSLAVFRVVNGEESVFRRDALQSSLVGKVA